MYSRLFPYDRLIVSHFVVLKSKRVAHAGMLWASIKRRMQKPPREDALKSYAAAADLNNRCTDRSAAPVARRKVQ